MILYFSIFIRIEESYFEMVEALKTCEVGNLMNEFRLSESS